MPGNMEYRRPDLEALEVNPDFRYIGGALMPMLNKNQKTGKVYYMTLPSDQAAETGRAAGTAPTRTALSPSNATYTCVEYIRGSSVDDSDDALMDGLESCNRNMTLVTKRSLLRAHEDAVEAVLFALTAHDIGASLIQAMDTAIDSIHRYSGRTVVGCGWTTFRRMTRLSEVTNTLLRTYDPGAIDYATIVNLAAPRLAEILGVEEVLVGDDDHWEAGKAVVMKQPDASTDPKGTAQFGRTVQYLPDGEQPFTVEAFYDPDDKLYKVDSRAWWQLQSFNTGAAYLLSGIDEGNVTTTTAA